MLLTTLLDAAPSEHPLGNQRPRIWSFPPYVTSAAGDAIELGHRAGIQLDEWQEWLMYPCMGERPDGKWSAGEVKWVVSRQNGKGGGTELRELAGLYLFAEELLIHTAHKFNTAQEAFRRLLAIIEGCPDLDAKVMRTPKSHGEEGIELLPTPTLITGVGSHHITRSRTARLRFLARSPGAARGFSADLLLYDEDMYLDAEDAGSSLPSKSARRNVTPGGPQVWYTGSAGLRVSTQAARLRSRALKALDILLREVEDPDERREIYLATLPALGAQSYAGGLPGTDRRLAYAEWSSDPHDEMCEPDCREHEGQDAESIEAVVRANPGFGIRVYAEDVADELGSLGVEEYARERLGVGTWPVPGDAWLVIAKAWWEGTRMAPSDRHRPSQRVMAIDSTPAKSWTAIAACGPRPDDRLQVALVDHRAGIRWVVDAAIALNDEVGPICWVIDPRSPAGGFIPELEDAGLRVEQVNGTQIAYACGDIYADFRDDRLRHPEDLAARKGFANATDRKVGRQWAWARTDDDVDLSTTYAYTLAHWGWKQYGAEGDYDATRSVGWDTGELIRLLGAGTYGMDDVQRIWSRGLLTGDDLTAIAEAGHAWAIPPAIMREA